MKNITVSIPDDIYARARMVAAQQSTTVSAMVKSFLQQCGQEDEAWRRQVEERNKMMGALLKKTRFGVGPKPAREELHAR